MALLPEDFFVDPRAVGLPKRKVIAAVHFLRDSITTGNFYRLRDIVADYRDSFSDRPHLLLNRLEFQKVLLNALGNSFIADGCFLMGTPTGRGIAEVAPTHEDTTPPVILASYAFEGQED